MPLSLNRKEFDLLAVLANASGGSATQEEILSEIWSGMDDGGRQNLRRVLGSLRRKIEPEPERPTLLVSLRGRGYRLNVQER